MCKRFTDEELVVMPGRKLFTEEKEKGKLTTLWGTTGGREYVELLGDTMFCVHVAGTAGM